MFPKSTPAQAEPMTFIEWVNFIAAILLIVLGIGCLVLLVAGLLKMSLPLLVASIACSLIITNILALATFQYRGSRGL